ncbi:hypothetical protein [Sphaerimonospora mesophila]|uniref:hypothetical protein n=1 Tax=Sphaerimonospora mesophila TaxID=37483 RepID=UPI000AD6AA36
MTELTFRDQLRDALRSVQNSLATQEDDFVELPAEHAEVLLHAASAHASWMGVRDV